MNEFKESAHTLCYYMKTGKTLGRLVLFGGRFYIHKGYWVTLLLCCEYIRVVSTLQVMNDLHVGEEIERRMVFPSGILSKGK